MKLQTKYITVDEFNTYFGVDLREDLGTDEGAIAFIKRVEDRMATYIDSNFNRCVDREFPEFSDYQKEHYKLALLEQCLYIWRNGDISVDSGVDDDGEKLNYARIQQARFSPNAIDNLILCGLLDNTIRHSKKNGWFFI